MKRKKEIPIENLGDEQFDPKLWDKKITRDTKGEVVCVAYYLKSRRIQFSKRIMKGLTGKTGQVVIDEPDFSLIKKRAKKSHTTRTP